MQDKDIFLVSRMNGTKPKAGPSQSDSTAPLVNKHHNWQSKNGRAS